MGANVPDWPLGPCYTAAVCKGIELRKLVMNYGSWFAIFVSVGFAACSGQPDGGSNGVGGAGGAAASGGASSVHTGGTGTTASTGGGGASGVHTGGASTAAGTGGSSSRTCGGIAGIQCRAGEYCDYPPSANCGAADQMGTCARPLTGACADIYEPVCGCDNKTYSNSCAAGLAGVSIAYNGACH